MDGTYTIVEDLFNETNTNQTMAATNYVNNNPHVPRDMRLAKITQQNQRLNNLQRPREDHPALSGSGVGYPPPYPPPQPQFYPQQVSQVQSPPMIRNKQLPIDNLNCKEVFIHMESCPFCSQYYKKDVKFYWLIIIILLIVLLFISTKNKQK